MWCYTVLPENGNRFAGSLAGALKACGYHVLEIGRKPENGPDMPGKPVVIVPEDEEGRLRARKPDIVVVPPMAVPESFGFRRPISCRAAVLPGSQAVHIAGCIRAKCSVTYGMSGKDTITLSSTKDTPMLAVQREIISLAGARTDIQEIPFSLNRFETPEEAMAAAAVLLLSGTPPLGLSEAL